MDQEKTGGSGGFGTHFTAALTEAAESCHLALRDLLLAHSTGDRIDTKVLKDVTAALKDLNGLGGEEVPDRTLNVVFSSQAEAWGG